MRAPCAVVSLRPDQAPSSRVIRPGEASSRQVAGVVADLADKDDASQGSPYGATPSDVEACKERWSVPGVSSPIVAGFKNTPVLPRTGNRKLANTAGNAAARAGGSRGASIRQRGHPSVSMSRRSPARLPDLRPGSAPGRFFWARRCRPACQMVVKTRQIQDRLTRIGPGREP